MNGTLIPSALSADRSHTPWSMAASATLHALLLAWLVLFPPRARQVDPITEITLIGAGELEASASTAAAPAVARESSPGVAAASSGDERFRRVMRSAEVAPDPQLDAALDDRMNARLAALQSDVSRPTVSVAAPAPAALWGSTPATVSGPGGGGGSPIALRRGGSGSAPALELIRDGGHGVAPALIPSAEAIERSATAAPAKTGEATARRTLAGATLMGPIADRRLLSHVTPIYPEWAKREGVQGSVTLYFVVSPDGNVRENVLVQKTAGFEDFDERALAALRAWRFEPLRDGRTGEQWGTITFHFRLRDGG